jgi:aspartyl-tRNA(Asn)/glutamyl-tRNA(Gln) amidotransferase subunit C
MQPQINEDDVRQVAKLARLRLSDDEVGHFAQQLESVLSYVRKLDDLNVEGVEPLFHPGDRHSVTRPDRERPGLTPDQALANAPAREQDFFRVPRVLGEGGGA